MFAELDHVQRTELNTQYRDEGLATLREVRLPSTFSPTNTDFVFLRRDNQCEVFIGAEVRFLGSNRQWKAICESEELPGRARLVTSVRGDVNTAVNKLDELLDLAPEQEDEDQAERDQPLPEPRRRRRRGRRIGLRNLVEERRNDPRGYVGRERQLRALKTSLIRQAKPGVVLVAKSGVGKTTLVEMLAEDIAFDRNIPDQLRGVAIYDLPLGAMVENGGRVGNLERQARTLFEQTDRAVVFIDEIQQLARPELSPLCDLIKPALAEGSIRLIGATTPPEWRKLQDAAFKRRFLELDVGEPTPKRAFEMLVERKKNLERHHRLTISERAVREAVMMSDRYLPLRALPDKAVDVLDQAAAMQLTSSAASSKTLEPQSLRQAVAAQSRIASDLLVHDSAVELIEKVTTELEDKLHGQKPALSKLRTTLKAQIGTRFVGWDRVLRTFERNWEDRPLATLLACGPSGTGKTETARHLAQRLFDGNLITLNGSDVGPEAQHGIAMWVGSPPGYVGSQQGGSLTNGVRSKQSAVILVDEVEKAGPEAIQNVLLPLLGDGVVTDRNTGETLHARDCIVFCTSNIQIEPEAMARIGFGARPNEEQRPTESDVYESLTRFLRPEVVARLNAVLLYGELDLKAQWAIWSDLRDNLETRIGPVTRIDLDDDARRFVQDSFLEMSTGARGICDLFRRELLPLVAGASAGDVISVSANGGQLVRQPRG